MALYIIKLNGEPVNYAHQINSATKNLYEVAISRLNAVDYIEMHAASATTSQMPYPFQKLAAVGIDYYTVRDPKFYKSLKFPYNWRIDDDIFTLEKLS